ncbi:complex I NDUFA9 subunit family protein [Bordetella petrii]|uniref:complex I NDUFA9 subunit family protein n=1 Tax=Bordetella petrii TaxID=94624 RepID=UPI001E43737A|nr:complex I NDUFA9 subunit family protein [Bordetella petrii]MCD0504311.1 complex I NDUFA9 subunit family protein [Bordetella petrii]
MRILLIGGTGFIGRHVAARLAARGNFLMVPTRQYGRGRDLQLLPTVTITETDVHDDDALDRLLHECDAVINLAGILHGGRGQPYGAGFARVHVQLPQRVAQACRRRGVRRLLHMSALGADASGPSMYLRSKGDGEAAVRAVYADWPEGACTIFRPSVVFGPDDHLTTLFARLARWLPVIPLAGAGARMQPVYVGDVAAAFEAALGNSHTAGGTYELCGPQVHTLGEIVRLCALWSGHPRPVYAMPMGMARLQAMLFECLPGDPLISRDNLASLSVDNVCSGPMPPELGVAPLSMEAVVPGYLKSGS